MNENNNHIPTGVRCIQVPCRYPDYCGRCMQVPCRYPDKCHMYEGTLQVS